MKSTNKDKIYFPTDASAIVMGGKKYGADGEALQADIKNAKEEVLNTVSEHAANTANPHNVTKAQLGLSQVTNDAQIPLSKMGQPRGVAVLDNDGMVFEDQLKAVYPVLYARTFQTDGEKTTGNQFIKIEDFSGISVEKDETDKGGTTTKKSTLITNDGVTLTGEYTMSPSGATRTVTTNLSSSGLKVGSAYITTNEIKVDNGASGVTSSLGVFGISVSGGLSSSKSVTIMPTAITINNTETDETKVVEITPTSITIGSTTIDEDQLKKLLALIG